MRGGGRRPVLVLVVCVLVASLLPLVLGAARVSAEAEVAERTGIDYGRGQLLDSFLPAHAAGPVPAVVVVHGGGWRTGSRTAWSDRARDLAQRTGWAAFSIDYDLDATEPYVTQPADLRAAITWVRAHAATLGVDPLRIALLGSSAGGHLAMLVATTATGADRVSAVVSWSGPSDLPRLDRSPRGDAVVKRLAVRYNGAPLDAEPRRWIEQSPVAHVDPGDPPMLLAGSVDETMVPIDQVLAMRDTLLANRVDVEALILPGSRHASAFADDVWRQTIQFLRDHV